MPAVCVAAALAVLYLVLDPPSADLAAQTYRVDLFDRAGWSVWDNGWYAGHHLPGYSVLFPPLGSALGLHVVAALSLVGATAAFTKLAQSWLPKGATAASLWFATTMAATIVSGRLAFALGAAVATATLAAVAQGSKKGAAAGGALTALASPVAALFAALIAAAAAAGVPEPIGKIRPPDAHGEPRVRRRISAVLAAPDAAAAATLMVASLATTGALVELFPE
ncbi:MAG: hypothetical protein QOG68_49, partial [Solirubrobacteraceae bacterium]|nr:hypothetical protein [Solirubrobacteraceae bacterium]